MTAKSEVHFKRNYETHLKHLKLKGLRPLDHRGLCPGDPADRRVFRSPDR